MKAKKEITRCAWVPRGDELYEHYHDTEWGIPVYDDKKLFEFIVLESAQAGLSWRTILGRRDGYRKAFKNFDVKAVARMTESDVERLMGDVSIIRNRLKIAATITNAKAFIAIQKEFGSFSSYFWSWTNGKIITNAWKSLSEIPPVTDLAVQISKDMKKRGFKFLGPTIMYAHMQACGMVSDHMKDCFVYKSQKR